MAQKRFKKRITARRKKRDDIIRQNRILAAINNIAIAIGRSVHLEEFLNTAQEEILKLLRLKKSIIYLIKDNSLEAATYRGFSEETINNVKIIKIGDGPAGRAIGLKETILIDDIAATPCEIINLSKEGGIKGCMFVPLKSKEAVMGLFIICYRKPSSVIKEIGLLESISNHMGTVIENALLLREKERAYEELKSIQDRLVQMETLSAIGKLTAGLAHEIGTPLNIISGRAEYLLHELGDDDKGSASLKVIISQIERITDLVKRLLTLTSSERATDIEDTNIKKVISDVLTFMERKIINCGINIENFLSDDLPLIKMDPRRLQQVFINIISNSLDATPKNGKIILRTYLIREGAAGATEPNSFICIEITDTGCGIDEKYLDKIFDPFFTTKKAGEGTGLGLTISKNIINEYGGDLEVKSKVGEGTTFIIRLPIKI
jgi:signal transduction histidine kinase